MSERQSRLVFVTGGSGIGSGIAVCSRFSEQGDQVIVNGRNSDDVHAACEKIRSAGGVAFPAVFDISNTDEASRFFKSFQENNQRLPDVFVHNAASRGGDYLIQSLTDEDWQNELNTILTGCFNCIRHIVPGMTAKKYGKIILISSNAATTGSWGRNAGYAAAKAGLLGLGRRLAIELAAHQINVNCIVPSQIETARTKAGGRRSPDYFKNYVEQFAPLGRVAQPADLAAMVCFLASDDASYLTGQTITLDGGTSFPPAFTKPASVK